ncbi:MAG: hypothetical protein QF886_09945, partial [Planctomycetota bacterium]|nr:hypothetical protein [Planctomycetota bacterium]
MPQTAIQPRRRVKKRARPFETNLEYLSAILDYLTLLAQKRTIQKKLQKQKAGLTRRGRAAPWDDDDSDDSPVELRRELLSNHSRTVAHRKKILDARVAATLAAGEVELPLETMAKEHQLSEFEKLVLILVLGPTLDNTFEDVVNEATHLSGSEVGGILDVLCETLEEKIRARKYFTSSSKLLALGLLNLGYSRGIMSENDFLSMGMELPRQVSSHLLGEYDIDDQLVTFSS